MLTPITAEYPSDDSKEDKSLKGLAGLTFPFNLATNIAMMAMVATHSQTTEEVVVKELNATGKITV